MTTSDLQVEPQSDALEGTTLDVIVSGSIAAVESVRFVRALRRLGAKVVPWLTDGGAQFITETALAWAADHDVRRGFSGSVSHLATGDACVVAPASSNFIQKIAYGTTDTAPSALVASYLGLKKPVLVLPNMHDSLAKAPAVQRNLQTLSAIQDDGCVLLDPRLEEGKQKFPLPEVLAAQVAHHINRKNASKRILVTMGTTRGYIDDVRYLSNYSSGGLGSAIVEEFYLQGFTTDVICGPCPITPRFTSEIHTVQTTEEMALAVQGAAKRLPAAGIFAASVLDYAPADRQPGKLKSGQDSLTINCLPTPKIIGLLEGKNIVKIGFKLESDLDAEKIQTLAADYGKRYQLRFMVLNALSDVSAHKHKATLVNLQQGSTAQALDGKPTIARVLAREVSALI